MSDSVLVPVAPYRVLEAIWYADNDPGLNENKFSYPYTAQMSVQMNSQVTITKRLKQLSGTALIFDVEAPNGVTGSIQIKAHPVKKNISEVTWNIPAHQFNGKTDLISNWLQSTVSLVHARFSS